MRILLVEDHPDLTRMAADHFVECGFVVDAVRTLEEAREVLGSGVYDILVLDLNLPDGDGKELLGDMSGRRLDTVPTIVMSAHDSRSGWRA